MASSSDEERFSALCERLHPRLVAMLVLYTGDRELAFDLAQETLARLWQRWPRISEIDPLDGYAFRTATNLARNHFRWAAVRRRHHERLGPSEPVVSQAVDGAETAALELALGSLPHRQRVVVILRYVMDVSVEDTATATGIPNNTVKSLARRGLSALRETLQPRSDQEVTDGHRRA